VHSRHLISAAICAIAAASAGSAAHAQTPGAPAQGVEATAAGGGLEEIVVTARRREERLQTAPYSVTAFSGSKLEQRNVTQLTDLALAVPNLSITKQAAYTSAIIPAIRGISESDTVLTNDSPISVYLDGVLIARDIGANIDLGEIDRVEVDRGPQGTLFGRNTTGGAIAIFTKPPADDFGLSQKVAYGSDNELTTRTVIDSGLLGDTGLKIRLTYSHHQMDGFIRNTYDGPSLQPGHPVYNEDQPSKWPGADDSHAIYLVVHDDLTDQLSVDYRFDYTYQRGVPVGWQTSVAAPTALAYFSKSPKFGGDPFVVAPNFLSTIHTSDTGGNPKNLNEPMGNAVTVNYSVNDALNFKSITAIRSIDFQDYSSLTGQGNLRGVVLDPKTFLPSVQQVTPYSVVCFADGTDGCSNEHQNQVSEEFQANGTLGNFKYVAGLYYFTEQVADIDPQHVDFPISPLVAFPTVILNHYSGTSTTYAAFGELSYKPEMFDDQLELTGGFRFTRDEKAVHIFPTASDVQLLASKRFNAPSGDFTVKYQWDPDFMTYFRFANGYRSGGFNGRQDLNPNGYGPETANSFEWGVKSELFDHHLRLNADLFYTVYDNKQVTSFVPVNGSPVSNTVNVGSATYLGGELDASYLPDRNWEFDLSFGYTSPSYDGYKVGENIGGVPQVVDITDIAKFAYFSKASMNIGVQYTFDPLPVGDLSVRLDYAYKSGQIFGPDPIASPFDDQIASKNQNDLSVHVTLAHIPTGLERADLTGEFYGTNLTNQHLRVQGIDFGYFADNAYSRPIAFGFALTAKY
jgi:iron complex outermembrane receptor protein